jgi:RNA polymerase sigma factor (sigma-70 family)
MSEAYADEVLPQQNVLEQVAHIAQRAGNMAVASETEPVARIHGKNREIEGRDSVGLYMDEIARTPLLDAAREVELSKTIEAGLFAQNLLDEGKVGRAKGGAPGKATREELEWLAEEGQKATTEFIHANLRLVVSIARKYGRSQLPMLDLIQEGNTGLIRAVEKFDYQKGYKFSTYATWWVRQAITRGIAQQARIIRLPVHVVEQINQVGGATRTLERQLGREPQPHEIAAELGIDTDRVLDLMSWGREHISLDTPVDEDGDTSLGDLRAQESIPSPDVTVLDLEARDRLNKLVKQLDERAADIIRARYGLIDGRQHKLADVGARHGISAERIRQLEREALQKLRRLADPDLAE